MNEPHSLDPIEQLLPALPHIARLARRKSTITRDDLCLILPATTIHEERAVDELQSWADVLLAARAMTSDGQLNNTERHEALHALMQRGVPQAQSQLAIAEAIQTASQSDLDTILPIRLDKHEIALGELPVGQNTHSSITASGGPGRISWKSDQVMVEPPHFGPQPTSINIAVRGGSDGQMLWGPLLFESKVEKIEVEVTAHWSASAVPSTLLSLPSGGTISASSSMPVSDSSPDMNLDWPPETLAPHVPWSAQTYAARHLFIKLFTIGVVVAILLLNLMRLLHTQLNSSLTQASPRTHQKR